MALAAAGVMAALIGFPLIRRAGQASGWLATALVLGGIWLQLRGLTAVRWIGSVALVLASATFIAPEPIPTRLHLAAAATAAAAALSLWLGTDGSGRLRPFQTGAICIAVLALALLAAAGRSTEIAAAAAFGVAGIALLARVSEQRESALARQALTDELTGLSNLRAFRLAGARALASLRRTPDAAGSMVALLLIDLDHFKAINDGSGHAAGDRLLAGYAAMLRAQLREDDVIARIGGDEFAVLLGGATADLAAQVGARLARACASLRIEGVPSAPSASFGITALSAEDASIAEAMARADLALYRAKSARS